MAKLPFIVEPRLKPIVELIGSEESGKIEVERRGYLTASEKAFVQAQVENDDSTQQLVALTREVGLKLKCDMQAAYQLTTEVMQGQVNGKKHQIVAEEFGGKINEILSSMTTMSERKRLVAALAMLIYRVDPEFSADDLVQLHPDLIEGLADLYQDEEDRSVERLNAAVEAKAGEAEGIDALEKK